MPRQEFMELRCLVIVDAAEHIGEPGFGIDVVELGGGDERVDRRCSFAAAIGAAEGPVSAAECDTTQRPLGAIVGQTDEAIRAGSGNLNRAVSGVSA